MEELRQQGLFRSYRIQIGDSQLLYRISQRGTHKEHTINFEQLGGIRTSQLRGYPLLWIAAAACALVGLGILLSEIASQRTADPGISWFAIACFGGLALLLTALFFLLRSRYWRIATTDQKLAVLFYQRKPSVFVVDQFYQRLLDARNAYLFRQYATLEDNLAYEEHLSNLKWLRSIQAIDGVQYDALYRELKKRTDPGSTRIGFSTNPERS